MERLARAPVSLVTQKAMDKSSEILLAKVTAKLDPVLEEMRLIREEHQKVAARQNSLEEAQAVQDGKLSRITSLIRNEVIDRRMEWYQRNLQELFAKLNCVIVAPNSKITPQPKLTKVDIERFLESKLSSVVFGHASIMVNGRKSYKISFNSPNHVENNRFAASLFKMSKVFGEELNAVLLKDVPRSLQPLRTAWSFINAKLRQDKMVEASRFKCLRGFFRYVLPSPGKAADGTDIPGPEVPIFPECLVHPDFDVLPFVALIKQNSAAILATDPSSLTASQQEHGILFLEASNALLDSMSGARRDKSLPRGSGGLAAMASSVSGGQPMDTK